MEYDANDEISAALKLVAIEGNKLAKAHFEAVEKLGQDLIHWLSAECEKRDLQFADGVVVVAVTQASLEHAVEAHSSLKRSYASRLALYQLARSLAEKPIVAG
jgi:hypothetical protein